MDVARKNSSVEAWRERIIAQQAGGESIRAWCRQNDCHEHAFYWWRAKLGLSPKSGVKRPGRQVMQHKFVEVVVGRQRAAEHLTLRLRGGRELILPSMSVDRIVELIRAIEGLA
jgi:hypothetical protein